MHETRDVDGDSEEMRVWKEGPRVVEQQDSRLIALERSDCMPLRECRTNGPLQRVVEGR